MGMGGSSLFPEVLARTFEPAPGRPRLHVLDTTDPAAIARIGATCPPERTLHLASSKSGSHHRDPQPPRVGLGPRRRRRSVRGGHRPRFRAGRSSPRRGFAEVFENRSDIGGRYAALSLFGIVPALLVGADAAGLLRGGLDGAGRERPRRRTRPRTPALDLAAALAARGGRSAATSSPCVLDPGIATLGLWLEQLVAESLGKDGTGVVPIVGEPLGEPDGYGDDRVFLTAGTDPELDLEAAGHPVARGAG